MALRNIGRDCYTTDRKHVLPLYEANHSRGHSWYPLRCVPSARIPFRSLREEARTGAQEQSTGEDSVPKEGKRKHVNRNKKEKKDVILNLYK